MEQDYITAVYKNSPRIIRQLKSDFIDGKCCALCVGDCVSVIDKIREIAEQNDYQDIIKIIE